jgi:hypothetical protein
VTTLGVPRGFPDHHFFSFGLALTCWINSRINKGYVGTTDATK